MTPDTKKPGIYYGWFVVAALTFTVFVTVGARNVFGVFVVPMEEEFGWNRFDISIAAAMGVLANGLIQPFAGRLFDRTGGRNMILASLVVVGLVTILLSLTFHILFLISFVFVYVNNAPTPSSFMAKLVGIPIVTLMIVMGNMGSFILETLENRFDEYRRAELKFAMKS